MSSIQTTRSGSHEVVWYEAGERKTKTRPTLGEAEALKAQVDRLAAEGRPFMRREDVPSLRDFALAEMGKRKKLEPPTRAKYYEWLEVHILPELGHLSLVDLRPDRLLFWQDERLAAGAGPAVLGKAQGLLHWLLDRAVLAGYLPVNPTTSLPRPEYEKRQARWLEAAEVERMRAWFLDRGEVGSAAFVSVQAYVGIRPQDTLARRAGDLGVKLAVTSKNVNGKIVRGSKTGDGYMRRVYVPAPVLGDLAQLGAAGLLFTRSKDGKPWTKKDYDNWSARKFKQAAGEVGLGCDLRPYDLRHTCASLLAAAGKTHVEVAHQLGHSPQESMRTYQHLIDLDYEGPRPTIDQQIEAARRSSVVCG